MEFSILIPKSLICDLQARAAAGLPNEVGGFLTGARTNMGAVISKATGPYHHDRFSRTTFKRLDKQHSVNIMNSWRESGTKETLLGDWHSHTSSSLEYSYLDKKGWKSMISKNHSPMVGLIVNADTFNMYQLLRKGSFTVTRVQKIAENSANILFRYVD